MTSRIKNRNIYNTTQYNNIVVRLGLQIYKIYLFIFIDDLNIQYSH